MNTASIDAFIHTSGGRVVLILFALYLAGFIAYRRRNH